MTKLTFRTIDLEQNGHLACRFREDADIISFGNANTFHEFGARLSISPTNQRALRFYVRRGWTDSGPRPDMPEVH